MEVFPNSPTARVIVRICFAIIVGLSVLGIGLGFMTYGWKKFYPNKEKKQKTWVAVGCAVAALGMISVVGGFCYLCCFVCLSGMKKQGFHPRKDVVQFRGRRY